MNWIEIVTLVITAVNFIFSMFVFSFPIIKRNQLNKFSTYKKLFYKNYLRICPNLVYKYQKDEEREREINHRNFLILNLCFKRFTFWSYLTPYEAIELSNFELIKYMSSESIWKICYTKKFWKIMNQKIIEINKIIKNYEFLVMENINHFYYVCYNENNYGIKIINHSIHLEIKFDHHDFMTFRLLSVCSDSKENFDYEKILKIENKNLLSLNDIKSNDFDFSIEFSNKMNNQYFCLCHIGVFNIKFKNAKIDEIKTIFGDISAQSARNDLDWRRDEKQAKEHMNFFKNCLLWIKEKFLIENKSIFKIEQFKFSSQLLRYMNYLFPNSLNIKDIDNTVTLKNIKSTINRDWIYNNLKSLINHSFNEEGINLFCSSEEQISESVKINVNKNDVNLIFSIDSPAYFYTLDLHYFETEKFQVKLIGFD